MDDAHSPRGEVSITINEYAERVAAGLRRQWVDIDELGNITVGVEPPPGQEPEPETKTRPEPAPGHARPRNLPDRPAAETRSELTGRLEILRGLAWKRIGKPQTITLNNGLRVDLIVEKSGTYRLLLARQGVYPSDRELATVLAHWPGGAPEEPGEPERFEHGGWCCVKTVW